MSCKAPAHISRCFGDTCAWCKVSPAPSPQPEMPEGDGWVKIATAQAERTIAGDVWMPLVALKAVLATRGLTIAGPAERAVLDACAAMTEEGIDAAAGQSGSVDRALEDELARRAAKEGTNGQ